MSKSKTPSRSKTGQGEGEFSCGLNAATYAPRPTENQAPLAGATYTVSPELLVEFVRP